VKPKIAFGTKPGSCLPLFSPRGWAFCSTNRCQCYRTRGSLRTESAYDSILASLLHPESVIIVSYNMNVLLLSLYLNNFAIISWEGLHTDHEPLFRLSTQKMEAMLCGWALAIQDHDFNIVHRKGSTNTNADTLSQLPPPYCSFTTLLTIRRSKSGSHHICDSQNTAFLWCASWYHVQLRYLV